MINTLQNLSLSLNIFINKVSDKNMSRRTSKRVSFSPEPEENNERINSSLHGHRKVVRSSPAARRLLQCFGARVANTLRFISFGRKSSSTNTKTTLSSTSSSSSSSFSATAIYLMKSKSLNESESHRKEAIEDCIQFLNSSSSMSRSNSVSAWSC